jgi:hypothetical protein
VLKKFWQGSVQPELHWNPQRLPEEESLIKSIPSRTSKDGRPQFLSTAGPAVPDRSPATAATTVTTDAAESREAVEKVEDVQLPI